MKDFNIQLASGSLDVYEQEINFTWRNIRFSDALQDAYSTDVTLPKTPNNCNLLQISGLLDSTSQLFGDKISPSVLNVGSDIISTWLQVTQITEDDITVCLYERTLPNELTQKTLNELLPTDDSGSIWAWNKGTLQHAPAGVFRTYYYGMGYDANYAQYHPVKPLSDLLNLANAELALEGLAMPVPSNATDLMVMATKKTVCPENPVQVVEFNDTDMSDNMFNIHGGQHVTNDMDWGGADRITFNRECHVSLTISALWWKKSGTLQNKTFQLFKNHNAIATFTIPSANYEFYKLNFVWSGNLNEGDYLQFYCTDTDRFHSLSFVAKLYISNYDIYTDDYGEELKYVGRYPRWRVKSPQSWGGATSFVDSDGKSHQLLPGTWVQTEYLSFAYFGYWCNLPEITVKNLLWGLCWLNGKKLIRNGNTADFMDCNDGAVLEQANIDSISPQAEEFGQTNHLCFAGEEQSQQNKISTIENVWLDKTKTLHKSPFAWASNWGTLPLLQQYSNPEKDVDDDGNVTNYSCDFNEVDGFAIFGKYQSGQLYKLTINRMGLDKITQTMRVEITCWDKGVKNADYVWVNGKKFMVIEADADLETGATTLQAVLVPPAESNVIPFTPHSF